MTPEEAYTIASQWGSYLNGGDSGAVFYSFFVDDATPVSETHRSECLCYLDNHCMPAAFERAFRECSTEAIQDVQDLVNLRQFFEHVIPMDKAAEQGRRDPSIYAT